MKVLFDATAPRAGKIDAVIVGADRVAANGDTANKIGERPRFSLHSPSARTLVPSSGFSRRLSTHSLVTGAL